MNRITQADDIFNALKAGGNISGFSLASRLGIPDASVRRAIRSLRAAGHDIRTSLSGYRFYPVVAPVSESVNA